MGPQNAAEQLADEEDEEGERALKAHEKPRLDLIALHPQDMKELVRVDDIEVGDGEHKHHGKTHGEGLESFVAVVVGLL